MKTSGASPSLVSKQVQQVQLHHQNVNLATLHH